MSNSAGASRSRVRQAREIAAWPTSVEAIVTERWSHLWKNLDVVTARQSHGWPDWCLRPAEVYDHVVALMLRDPDATKDRADLARFFHLIDNWRQARVIVDFDPELATALWKTPLSGAPPAVLYQLLQRGLYLHLPAAATDGTCLHGVVGVWCALSYRVQDPRPLMVLMLDFGGPKGTFDVYIDLSSDSWDHAHDRLFHPTDMQEGHPPLQEHGGSLSARVEQRKKAVAALLVYLCSTDRDISRPVPVTVGAPRPGRAARTAQVQQVGVRIGAALRSARQTAAAASPRSPEDGTSRRVAPHMRRAHFHTYWTGPRTSEQIPTVRWLPPLPIGAGQPTAVVRRAR